MRVGRAPDGIARFQVDGKQHHAVAARREDDTVVINQRALARVPVGNRRPVLPDKIDRPSMFTRLRIEAGDMTLWADGDDVCIRNRATVSAERVEVNSHGEPLDHASRGAGVSMGR